ncbi:hypothetical protein [Zunongwangia pacifica]|uniref:Uncharacterized protein n=1 Tax=Zunongwangia pacifica TaxID=2911062 RepID=A0A9X1ZTR8_9FLAO|nr:hypothetical protein [Zunongwangia pacifica]MCL6217475.1 hypothetical protein [Zunongwangia pacifica]
MAEVDKIRNGLIDKILLVKNKELLMELDQLITSRNLDSEIIEISEEQEIILKMSESDIKNGDTISQDEMVKRNLEWLKEK